MIDEVKFNEIFRVQPHLEREDNPVNAGFILAQDGYMAIGPASLECELVQSGGDHVQEAA